MTCSFTTSLTRRPVASLDWYVDRNGHCAQVTTCTKQQFVLKESTSDADQGNSRHWYFRVNFKLSTTSLGQSGARARDMVESRCLGHLKFARKRDFDLIRVCFYVLVCCIFGGLVGGFFGDCGRGKFAKI